VENNAKLKLVAYIRVSTDAQVDGYGLDTQLDAVRTWAKANGHRIVEVFADEGVSGTTDAFDRAGLSSVIDTIETNKLDGLVVARLDRLARALTVQEAILAHLWRHDGRVFCADVGEVLADDPSDPMRTAMRQLAGVFAQLDRAMIAKRLRDGRRMKAERGGYVAGAPPFGWRAEGGTLVEHPGEQMVIARMRTMRAEGASLNAIADALNSEQVPTKRTGRWSATSVSRIIDPAARDRARRQVQVARRRQQKVA
jgi:DNA invertase Pin-like site-specific DNA recombinase